jgi:hypothetical protein
MVEQASHRQAAGEQAEWSSSCAWHPVAALAAMAAVLRPQHVFTASPTTLNPTCVSPNSPHHPYHVRKHKQSTIRHLYFKLYLNIPNCP